MTTNAKKIFSKKIKLDSESLDSQTGKHSFSIETKYLGELKWTVEIFNPAKTWVSSYSGSSFEVLAEVLIDGYSDKIAIFVNKTPYGTRMSGTLVKDSQNRWQAWVNMSKALAMWPTPAYEIWVVENEQDDTISKPWSSFDDLIDEVPLAKQEPLPVNEEWLPIINPPSDDLPFA